MRRTHRTHRTHRTRPHRRGTGTCRRRVSPSAVRSRSRKDSLQPPEKAHLKPLAASIRLSERPLRHLTQTLNIHSRKASPGLPERTHRQFPGRLTGGSRIDSPGASRKSSREGSRKASPLSFFRLAMRATYRTCTPIRRENNRDTALASRFGTPHRRYETPVRSALFEGEPPKRLSCSFRSPQPRTFAQTNRCTDDARMADIARDTHIPFDARRLATTVAASS